MNHTFNNVALFIKRAEEYQTDKFIADAFASNLIGKVSNVTFIKKTDGYGRSYNGAIVTFDKWYMNSRVQDLFQEMSHSVDRTARFYYKPNRFWFIHVHKLSPTPQPISLDSSLPDKTKINQLEAIIQSMSAQIYYLQTQHEQTERSMMSYEKHHTYSHLINSDLQSQLFMNQVEQGWIKDKAQAVIDSLRKDNNSLASQLLQKQEDISNLKQELYEDKSIIEFIKDQYLN